MSRADRILEYLRERRDPMVAYLRELAEAESPSTDPAAQAPVFRLLTEPLEELGFEVRRLPGKKTGGQLYARPRERPEGAPGQLLLGHTDTVWARGTVGTMPVVEEGGRLRGPGVFDMKGGLAQMIFALRALGDLGLEPEVTPVIFLNSDEEIGSPESGGRVRTLARRVARAWVLEPALGPEGRLKTARRGTGRFRVRAVGRTAHTGLDPEKGRSAILELSHVIQALHAMTDRSQGVEVNVGQVRGGTRPNVVAGEAVAEVDVRVPTVDEGRRLEERIRALEPSTEGTSLEIRGAVDRPPMERTPGNRALWRAAKDAGRALGIELEEGTSGGASDGNVTSRYTATLDGLGAVGDGAHAHHEYVDVSQMPMRAALLASLLLLPSFTKEGEAGVGEAEAGGPAPAGGGA